MSTDLIRKLQEKTGLKTDAIRSILKLLEEGSTIPFIARYRKEMTGGATDEILRLFDETLTSLRKVDSRREEILRLIEERGHLTPELKKEIDGAETLSSLENLYRPFKEKKNTRASQAIARGLSRLADMILSGDLDRNRILAEAEGFVKGEVKSVDEAIRGAQDIIAEKFSDDPKERLQVKSTAERSGSIAIRKSRSAGDKKDFETYYDRSEKVATIPSHRYLAIARGAREKELSLGFELDVDTIHSRLEKKYGKGKRSDGSLVLEAVQDGLHRLLLPSVEREIHSELKERSDRDAIHTFGRNLSQLLMTPPVMGKILLGVDPGYRTGCKLAVIDENGKFLDHGVMYPVPPRNDYESSSRIIKDLIKKYKIQGVAIGNGTGSRETQEFFVRFGKENGIQLPFTVVSEAGASVYSASDVATKEYPNLDPTIRGAISIAQRLRDPMAALVKIDPGALGVGQYQHDVDQKLLARKLHETIEDLVNRVGVDVNSASASLLSFVAGIGPSLAKAIVDHRDKNGPFQTRKDLKKVKGMGEKAFEQCAGFLRIRDGKNLLDNTGVHPESYAIAESLLKEGNVDSIPAGKLKETSEKLKTGIETLKDILAELKKPGFDPRYELPPVPFRTGVTDIDSLKPGSVVSGVVRNLTDFGAFVDIGIKNDGLIHISKMSQKRIQHPMEVLSIGQVLTEIYVLDVDREKGKVSLGLLPP